LAFESKSSPSPQEIGLESDLSPSPGLECYNSGVGLYVFRTAQKTLWMDFRN